MARSTCSMCGFSGGAAQGSAKYQKLPDNKIIDYLYGYNGAARPLTSASYLSRGGHWGIMRAALLNKWNETMENSAEEQVASKYNDSAADAVAALAILTIVIAAVVFWVAGQ